MAYLLNFFCLVIGIAFAWSFWGKVQDVDAFIAAINRFRLLPVWLHRPAAWVFLIGELLVAIVMLFPYPHFLSPWKSDLLAAGFAGAAILLLGFTFALGSVLARKIATDCNCFGASQKNISSWELLRNSGLIICALCGLALSLISIPTLGLLDSALMAAFALVSVTLWLQVPEIVAVFR